MIPGGQIMLEQKRISSVSGKWLTDKSQLDYLWRYSVGYERDLYTAQRDGFG
jgi:hypothetical protein